MNKTQEPLPACTRSTAVRLACNAVLALAASLSLSNALAQVAQDWSAPHQVTKLEWLAIVLQASKREGFCKAPVCQVRVDYDVQNASTWLPIRVHAFNATREEMRHTTLATLDDLRYTARNMFRMRAPRVRLSESLTSGGRGGPRTQYYAEFDCVLPATEFPSSPDSRPLTFEQSCKLVKR